MEVALFRQLEKWGVGPDILLGHSIGELAAAHVAGVWSLKDACRVVAARGRLMQALPEGGAMVAPEASEAEVLSLLEQYAGVEIAGLNGPRSTVISGDAAAVVAMAEHLRGRGPQTTFAGEPRVPFAANGPDAGGVPEGGGSVTYGTPHLPIVSNVTGPGRRGALQPGLLGATGAQPGTFFGRRAGARSKGSKGESRAWSGRRLDGDGRRMSVGGLGMQVVAAQRRGRDAPRRCLRRSECCTVHGVAVDWEKVAGRARAGRSLRFRPMRSSGSATGSRRRSRARLMRTVVLMTGFGQRCRAGTWSVSKNCCRFRKADNASIYQHCYRP